MEAVTIIKTGGKKMSRGELLFVDLVKAARSELIRVKYKEQRIKLYETIWGDLGCFMQKNKLQ